MKRAVLAGLVVSYLAGIIGMAQEQSAKKERGRVQIKNGTIVTDQGTLLRGGCSWSFKYGRSIGNQKYATDPKYYETMKSLGLNAIRLIWWEPGQKSGGWIHADLDNTNDVREALDHLDAIINLAGEQGMYVLLNYHQPGAYMNVIEGKEPKYANRDYMFKFWDLVAKRYSKRTHVVYELMNEPAWYAGMYTSKDEVILKDTVELYNNVRAAAPETHIVLLSFANTHEFDPKVSMVTIADKFMSSFGANAAPQSMNISIGYHPYYTDNKDIAIRNLMAKYPVVNTEMNIPKNMGGDGTLLPMECEVFGFQTMERLGNSWFAWQVEGFEKLEKNFKGKILKDAVDEKYMWKPDNFSAFARKK